MNVFMTVLIIVALALPWVSYAKDYTFLGKRGDYRGYATDSGGRVDFYDKRNRSDGWVDKDTGYVFDRRNNVKGTIYDFGDRDDD